MSLVKGKHEYNVILDVEGRQKVSKNFVRTALRKANVLELEEIGTSLYMIENEIRVGMYRIKLVFSDMSSDKPRRRLREYGGFGVGIYEASEGATYEQYKYINPARDKRFSSQTWVVPNRNYKLRIKDLINIVVLCARLDKMKAFN